MPRQTPRSLPWLLAVSHLRRRRGQNLITLLGVAVGVMVLTTALSLTNGFVRALVEATVKAQPHVDLQAWAGSSGADRDPRLEGLLGGDHLVSGWSPYARALGLLGRRAREGSGGGVGFAQVYGVEPVRAARALRLSAEESANLASLPEGGILLGVEIARQLGVTRGDEVVVTAASGSNPLDARRGVFRAAGTFRTGNYVI
ncbi:MAG TPA: ABC transporter permease, partial [Deinococcales bacterium]|nr:ABC transporter permease [Deinococcales bacterium]